MCCKDAASRFKFKFRGGVRLESEGRMSAALSLTSMGTGAVVLGALGKKGLVLADSVQLSETDDRAGRRGDSCAGVLSGLR